jgi:hypothetical protein
MTEAGWGNCDDPEQMLVSLGGKASERKLRLFGCACVRQVWSRLASWCREAVEDAEWHADGRAGAEAGERPRLPSRAGEALVAWVFASSAPDAGRVNAEAAAAFATLVPLSVRDAANAALAASRAGKGDEKSTPCALLRCLFGSPFRPPPAIPPSVLAWNGGCVVELANAIYEERALPGGTLDGNRLAVLADALEEAGLDDEEVLHHLREQGQSHVRGCWVVDLLLSKG